ncbi:MAG: hypothetical protein C4583_06520 [Anaerolineaceae bacterium]|nr:MAG: hypothetical protein C4583_06520 [Anaerolineaceae bacterium]
MTMLRTLIRFLAAWTILSTLFVLFIAIIDMGPNSRAVIFMGAGLVLLWIVLGGTLMWTTRDRVRDFVSGIRLPRLLTFVLFCTLLALTEEAVTVSMTNLAPLFGVSLGAAYITASANYLDVVALHSVVVFVPMFICWAWMLSRWDFRPAEVFLPFGLTGFLAEAQFAGRFNLAQAPFWIFVYELMVWLPAYTLSSRNEAKRPRWWMFLLAVILPFVFAIPVAIIISYLHPIQIHFPPIPPNS